LLNKNQ